MITYIYIYISVSCILYLRIYMSLFTHVITFDNLCVNQLDNMDALALTM